MGIQNKVLAAMATPVGVTPPVLGGLQAAPGQDLAVAEVMEAFAEAVLVLLGQPAAQRAMEEAGRAYVEALAERLEAVYRCLA